MSATHHVGPRRSSEPVILRRGNSYRVWWSAGSHEAQFVGVFLGNVLVSEESEQRILAFCEQEDWEEFRVNRASWPTLREASDPNVVIAGWVIAEKLDKVWTFNPTDIAMIRPTFSAWA